MAKFKIKTVLPGFKRLFGMTAEVYNEAGEIIQSIDLNNSLKRFTFKFNKNLAFPFQRSAFTNANLTIKLIDNNGDDFNFSKKNNQQFDLDADEQLFNTSIQFNTKRARTKLKPTKKIIDTTVGNLDPTPTETSKPDLKPVAPTPENSDNTAPVFTSGKTGSIDENVAPGTLVYSADATDASALSFTLSGGDSSDFTINSETGRVTINESPDFETKPLYSFNVVATDAQGNATKQDIDISVNDIQEGSKITLTPLLDTITANQLSNVDDEIIAGFGDLGNDFNDLITDGSTTDNDILKIKTNSTFDLFSTLNRTFISRITNIETIQIDANSDGHQDTPIDLSGIISLNKLDINGTFKGLPLILSNWDVIGATEFDFSGITSTIGVEMEFVDGETSNPVPLMIKGSNGPDQLIGANAEALVQGLGGADELFAPNRGNSILEGGAGADTYQLGLVTGNDQHTIRLHGQINQSSKDTAIGFIGFNDGDANVVDSFDFIEIDAKTFTNYSGKDFVEQLKTDRVLTPELTPLKNTIVTSDTKAILTTQNYDNFGDGVIAYVEEDSTLYYSASGDFTTDIAELIELQGTTGFIPVRQINVV